MNYQTLSRYLIKAGFIFVLSLTYEHLPVSDGDGRMQIERPEENKGWGGLREY